MEQEKQLHLLLFCLKFWIVDMQKYFNSFNNVKGSNIESTITHDETIKNLYDEVVALHKDKITLLEKLLNSTEKDLIKYRKKYGEL